MKTYEDGIDELEMCRVLAEADFEVKLEDTGGGCTLPWVTLPNGQYLLFSQGWYDTPTDDAPCFGLYDADDEMSEDAIELWWHKADPEFPEAPMTDEGFVKLVRAKLAQWGFAEYA